MIEMLLGAVALMISYWILAFFFGLFLLCVAFVFEWIVTNWVIILSVVLVTFIVLIYYESLFKYLKLFSKKLQAIIKSLLSIVFKFFKISFNYLKVLNKKLQPKTNLGVRVMMLLNILLYNSFSFFVVDSLFLQFITIGFSIYSLYIFIKPEEYFKIIEEKTSLKDLV